MADIISALLFWLGAHTGYHVSQLHANAAVVESYRPCRFHEVEKFELCHIVELREVATWEYMFYLRYDIDPENDEDRARLMHELVQWV